MGEVKKMIHNKTRRMTTAGMLIAAGILLPYVCSHAAGIPGNVFLPMHIPVLLIGLLCGPLYGGVCGLFIPLLNTVLTGMPAPFPNLPMMMGELFAYGTASGLLLNKTRLGKVRFGVYPALLGALLAGRVVYALLFEAILLAVPDMKGATVVAAFLTGLPGILVQLLIIPPIVLSLTRKKKITLSDAVKLIGKGKASSIVFQDGQLLKIDLARGISPILSMYDEGFLSGATVADKIVGKAAAMIFTLGGAKECYGETMSQKAYDWLTEHGVKATYGTLVEEIINRQGNGPCPMEATVKNITDEKLAMVLLRAKVKELRSVNA